MKQLYVRDINNRAANVDVSLQGWLRARRRSGDILFLDVVDSTGLIQCVLERSRATKELFSLARHVKPESAIEVCGTVVSHANKPREISVKSLTVIGTSDLSISPSPRSDFDIFDPKLTDHLLSNRHLYLRNPKIMAILQFRSMLTTCVRRWFEDQSFMEFDAPILTMLPLYDDGSAMGIDVHGDSAFLTQCVGFYLEAAVHAFERVYHMGPSFRGEESRSKRHLMEYHHIKAEIAFANLEDVIRIVESLISHISNHCSMHGDKIFTTLGVQMCLDGIKTPFSRISYEDAVEHLRTKGFDIVFGKGLGSAEEAELATLFNGPFWITGIPRAVEPFPYCIDQAQPALTRVADLIASNGYGELLGVAEKIHTIEMLDERLAEKGKGGDSRYDWIREVHQAGCVPHAAFGMGVERLIRWLLNIPHVRDAIPFPRIFRRRVYP
ncbi:asparagine--tRNA ligase [Patescibacteria group bacterium]|nr:asparagine--tRNA ligase [Patescibacteria group bacterium]